MSILEIKNLSLKLKDNEILKNLSFKLDKGEILAIIGESGSGKTMLSKLIMGFNYSNSFLKGEINFFQKNIFYFSKEQMRKYRGEKIGYIGQNPFNLFHHFQKIKEVFRETLLSHKNVSKEEVKNIAIKSLKEVNLENGREILEMYPFELSGGMLQRIMVALIISLESEIIIADEPTSALDSYNRFEIINIFKILKEKGISFILITHDYFLMNSLADRVLIMKEGEIIEEAKVVDNKVLSQSKYGNKLLGRKRYRRKNRE